MLKTNNSSSSDIYHAIVIEDVDLVHELITEDDEPDLSLHSFRAMDLRKYNFSNHKINFKNCYFKNTDLRGLDLHKCDLTGASLHNARISGVLFPENVSALEIELSVNKGTRIRTTNV